MLHTLGVGQKDLRRFRWRGFCNTETERYSLSYEPGTIRTFSLCNRRRKYYLDLADFQAGTRADKPQRPKANSKNYGHAQVREALRDGKAPRCCFCEKELEQAQVEHFRPVSRYPALAYEWSNFLLACAECNETHKSDQFPLDPGGKTVEEDRRNPCRRTDKGENPFLLNPFDDSVEEHLTFRDAYVVVRNHSPRGQYTRQVCQLNRKELVRIRKRYLGLVLRFIGDWKKATETDDAALYRTTAHYLQQLIAVDAHFSGMVRAELERVGIDWRIL